MDWARLGAIRRRDAREDDRDDRLDDKKKCRRIVASVETERARRRRDSIERRRRAVTVGDGGWLRLTTRGRWCSRVSVHESAVGG